MKLKLFVLSSTGSANQPPITATKPPAVLEYTKGRPACCILIVNEKEAYEKCLVGLKELIKYWDDNGMWIL